MCVFHLGVLFVCIDRIYQILLNRITVIKVYKFHVDQSVWINRESEHHLDSHQC